MQCVYANKPVGKDSNGTQWWVLDYTEMQKLGTGWICTVDGGCSTPAVYGDGDYDGLCLSHAIESGVAPPKLNGLVHMAEATWKASDIPGWMCTFLGCVAPAAYMCSAAGLCAYHAGYYIPLKVQKELNSAVEPVDLSLKIAGLHLSMAETQWKYSPPTIHWVCTYDYCGKPATWKSVGGTAGLCAVHAMTMSNKMNLMDSEMVMPKGKATKAYTGHLDVPSTPESPQPAKSVLSLASQWGKPVIVLPVATKGRGVTKADPLSIPWEQDWNKLHGVMSGGDHDVPLGEIGLHQHLPLPQAACEFYLLMDASLCPPSEHQEMAAKRFEQLTHYLASQMSLYIECACLGEARYAMGRVRDASNAKFLKNPKWMAVYNDLCVGDKDRYTVWKMFPVLSRKYAGGRGRKRGYRGKGRATPSGEGTTLLLFTVLVHDTLNWRSDGFGGKKWAECAKTVLAYRRRRIDPVSFVDTAFGLKHNGNIVFDKLWPVHGIERILDANQRGDMAELCKLASTEVTDLWKAACNDS